MLWATELEKRVADVLVAVTKQQENAKNTKRQFHDCYRSLEVAISQLQVLQKDLAHCRQLLVEEKAHLYPGSSSKKTSRRSRSISIDASSSSSSSSSAADARAQAVVEDETPLTEEEQKQKLEAKKKRIEQLEEDIQDVEAKVQQLEQQMVPKTGSLFTRLFLGRVNVKHYKDGERLRLKSEYEKFRFRTNPVLIIMAALELFFPGRRFLEVIFQVWLLYYYTTLALREQILRVNGSNIRPWWVMHHYISIVITICLLTLPNDSLTYLGFIDQFHWFLMCQGVVQILMNYYQRQRLYNLVARGQASRMDILPADLAVGDRKIIPQNDLRLLLPFLVFIHGFQLYNGWSLLWTYGWSLYGLWDIPWEVPLCGLLFITLGLGNIRATLEVYYQRLVRTAQNLQQHLSSSSSSHSVSPRTVC